MNYVAGIRRLVVTTVLIASLPMGGSRSRRGPGLGPITFRVQGGTSMARRVTSSSRGQRHTPKDDLNERRHRSSAIYRSAVRGHCNDGPTVSETLRPST